MTDAFARCHREDMDIRQVDVFDDSEVECFHQVTEQAEAFERPHHSGWSLDESKIALRRQVPTERSEVWAAYVEGTMVGAMALWFPLLDNLTKCWGAVGVDPDHRRRGVGSALVAQIVTRMAQEGRTTMLTETAYPFDRREDHPYRRFAEAKGFTVAIDEIRRILPLPVDPALLRTLADEVAPHHTDYRIASFMDSLPDELIADVWQWGTLVHREHRGHRLGTAVKVHNLQQLAGAGSGRIRVLTCNAETNHHMVDINVRLGFEAVEVAPMFELRIGTAVGERDERVAQVSASTT